MRCLSISFKKTYNSVVMSQSWIVVIVLIVVDCDQNDDYNCVLLHYCIVLNHFGDKSQNLMGPRCPISQENVISGITKVILCAPLPPKKVHI